MQALMSCALNDLVNREIRTLRLFALEQSSSNPDFVSDLQSRLGTNNHKYARGKPVMGYFDFLSNGRTNGKDCHSIDRTSLPLGEY